MQITYLFHFVIPSHKVCTRNITFTLSIVHSTVTCKQFSSLSVQNYGIKPVLSKCVESCCYYL